MFKPSFLATVLLLSALRPAVWGQAQAQSPPASLPGLLTTAPATSAPAGSAVAAPEKKGSVPGLDLGLFDPCDPVCWGDPEVAPGLWQRTWGLVGINGYPVGTKMAPNGVAYKPLFSLDLLLNVALTSDRELYLFLKTRFWGQKAAPGITNPSQGPLDFSKRQFDLDTGLAWNYTGRWEARAYVYSYNNLNRGTTLDKPFGYNDGFALENRYYLPTTNFDKGLYRFVGIGYYATKDMIGADGKTFKPSLYVNANLALDILPDHLYTYADMALIAERPLTAKLLLADVGVAFRPFTAIPDLEFRVGVDNNVDLDLGFTRSMFYGNVRVIW